MADTQKLHLHVVNSENGSEVIVTPVTKQIFADIMLWHTAKPLKPRIKCGQQPHSTGV
jgi:hypothetical protein